MVLCTQLITFPAKLVLLWSLFFSHFLSLSLLLPSLPTPTVFHMYHFQPQMLSQLSKPSQDTQMPCVLYEFPIFLKTSLLEPNLFQCVPTTTRFMHSCQTRLSSHCFSGASLYSLIFYCPLYVHSFIFFFFFLPPLFCRVHPPITS